MVVEMRGDPKVGIPAGSHCRLVSLPEQTTVWEGEASEAVSMDLPRGKYSLSVVKFHKKNNNGICYAVDYIVGDITEEQIDEVSKLDSQYVGTVYTSQGVRFTCRVKNCQFATRSMFEAKLHEGKHFGVDLLASPADAENYEILGERLAPRLGPGGVSSQPDVPVPQVVGRPVKLQASNAATLQPLPPKVVEKPQPQSPAKPIVIPEVKAGKVQAG